MAISDMPPCHNRYRRLRAGGLIAATAVALMWTQGVSRAADPASVAPPEMSLEELSATRDRPLFSPSRRPQMNNVAVAVAPPPPPPSPTAPPQPPPNLTFLGTFESATEVGAAVQILPKDKPVIIRYGTYISGWRVVDISRHRLVLALGDRRAEFTIFNSPETNEEAAGPPHPGTQIHPPPAITPVPGSSTPR